ncbi:MAG: NADH-quinone oxidoreductase subunit M, partial [Actinomycetota bacterium]|nr:NADH-quinone oxidoreductase subunit M [Actinomycetota bacterium]
MVFATAFPVLPALLVLPAVGAALVAVLPRRRPEVVKQVAMLFSTATAGIAFWVLGAFETGPGAAAFQFTAHQPWIGDLGI